MTQAQTETTQPEAPPVEGQAPEVSDFHKLIEDRSVSWHAPTIQETDRDLPALERQAAWYFNARLAGKDAKYEDVVARILAGYELGKLPMWSIRHLSVSKDGKIAMSAEAMRALFIERVPGGKLEVTEYTPERCTMRVWRPGKEWQQLSWTEEDSQRAGLKAEGTGQNGRYTTTHGKYPAAMKLARCTSALARMYWPDILGGCSYTPEELSDLADPSDAPAPAPDAPRAPTRAERQEPAEPPALNINQVYARWHALAQARKDGGDPTWAEFDDKAKRGAWFKAFLAALLGQDVPDPRTLTTDELAVIMADMDKNGTPVALDQREVPA